jgi:hypothetical protein
VARNRTHASVGIVTGVYMETARVRDRKPTRKYLYSR